MTHGGSVMAHGQPTVWQQVSGGGKAFALSSLPDISHAARSQCWLQKAPHADTLQCWESALYSSYARTAYTTFPGPLNLNRITQSLIMPAAALLSSQAIPPG